MLSSIIYTHLPATVGTAKRRNNSIEKHRGNIEHFKVTVTINRNNVESGVKQHNCTPPPPPPPSDKNRNTEKEKS